MKEPNKEGKRKDVEQKAPTLRVSEAQQAGPNIGATCQHLVSSRASLVHALADAIVGRGTRYIEVRGLKGPT